VNCNLKADLGMESIAYKGQPMQRIANDAALTSFTSIDPN